MRRKPLRLLKAYDNYKIKWGNAGFVIVYKNKKRLQQTNRTLSFNIRRSNPPIIEERNI